MKKITSLILAILMIFSMTVVSVSATEKDLPQEELTRTTSTNERELVTFRNEEIYIQKRVQFTPNKGWGFG